MTHPLLMRFAVLDKQQFLTPTGYRIVITTDHPCHLYLRWTYIEPAKHHVPIERRGAPIGTIIDQCFVVYHDVEQNEPGDTLVHTFVLTDWPACNYRWFYFWGTVGGDLSPSLSPIFEKHRKQPVFGPSQTLSFRPDPAPGITSCDGFVRRTVAQPYGSLRNGTGTSADPTRDTLTIQLQCLHADPNFTELIRAITIFDTSAIPLDSLIESAYLRVICFDRYWGDYPEASLGLTPCNPASNTTLAPADYQSFTSPLLTDTHRIDGLVEGNPIIFTFTPEGLEFIVTAGITRLMIREATWDIPNGNAPWRRRSTAAAHLRSADWSGAVSDRPHLVVTFREQI